MTLKSYQQTGEAPPKRVKARTKGVTGYKLVTRATKWGNPFSIADYGRERCLKMYELWLREDPNGQQIAEAAKAELRGYDLGCTCPLDQPCHADILIALVNK